MVDSSKNKVKKGKPKMFLLFLFVTTFIWFISRFSREFTANIEADIHYINAPHGVIVSENNFKSVTFDLTTSGFNFLYYKFKKPLVNIDLQKYIKKETPSFIILNNDFKRIITSQLKNDIVVNNVSIETMKVLLDKLKTKKVKVSLLENIQFKNGYKPVGGFKLSPDSIAISGPMQHLDTLTEITTELLKLSNVYEDINTSINLNIESDASITYSQKRIDLAISVKEFTQKSLLVPVIVENLPADLSIRLIPEYVTILFDVSMEDFNKITPNDFIILCDFNKKNNLENFLIPELKSQPESIINLEIQENNINYLIFK